MRPRLKRTDPPEWKIALGEGNSHRHIASFIARKKRDPIPQFEGTGIVMAAGGRSYLRMAFITISVIRNNGWNIPIEIWHMGPKELPHDLKRRFNHLEVQFIDAHQVMKKVPSRTMGGFELKSYAIANSSFRHVMLLDADCEPIQSPETLFNSNEYKDTGVIVAPDIKLNRKGNTIFNLMGIPFTADFWEGESGFIMIDKVKAWRALELTRWLNEFSDFYYRYVWGDKDLLPLSCLRLKMPYLMLPKCTWENFGIRHYWFDGSIVADHHMDQKRNPGAHVPPEHLRLWRAFEQWDQLATA